MFPVRSEPHNRRGQLGLGAPSDQGAPRRQRTLRGVAAAGFATFVALTSHVIGGGDLPSAMGVVVPLALSSLVCVLLAGRRLSLPRLSVSVLVSQSLFHFLFSVFTPIRGTHDPVNAIERHALHHPGAAGTAGSMPGMSGSAPGMTGSMSASSADASMHAHVSPAMLVAHLVAAALTIALIYWSEVLPAKIGTFIRLVLHAILPSLVRVTSIPNGPQPHLGVVDILPRHLGVLRSPVLTRGPPAEAF